MFFPTSPKTNPLALVRAMPLPPCSTAGLVVVSLLLSASQADQEGVRVRCNLQYLTGKSIALCWVSHFRPPGRLPPPVPSII